MKQLFFDVDTQIDFLFPAGSLYVPGAEKLIPTVAASTAKRLSSSRPCASMPKTIRNSPSSRRTASPAPWAN